MKFKIFGDTLTVDWTGSVWRTANGAQYGRLSDAIRHECEALIIDSGDDPREFTAEIEAAIARAEGREVTR